MSDKNNEIFESIDEIRAAIESELEITEEFADFRVLNRRKEGSLWILEIEPVKALSGLDESYEGSPVWWGSPSAGSADLLTIIPEINQIVLRYATGPPPDEGYLVRIYPPRYLESLKKVWGDDTWACSCIETLNGLLENQSDANGFLKLNDNLNLRKQQERSFRLTAYPMGFLWGPPGTGKTYTLGALLAQYLVQNKQSRICVVSSTNIAVDQVITSVDDHLEKMNDKFSETARKQCKRIGNHFIAKYYGNRKHLLPAVDEVLLKKLIQLQTNPPAKADIHKYDRWKSEVENIKKQIGQKNEQIIKESRLIALTTTRAAVSSETLKEFAPFDLMVYDEASQVGRAHAIAFLPLAERHLFAGDPMQLPPIVKSDKRDVRRWLGKSMFYYKNEITSNALCFLDEQSRMAGEICDFISRTFYEGKLKVAADCLRDAGWLRERKLKQYQDISDRNIQLLNCNSDARWDNRIESYERSESAEMIVKIIKMICDVTEERDIMVLTPFRAQRYRVRNMLQQNGHTIEVNTIHRAQGTERHTIIFDVTHGDCKFMKNYEALNMMNVALSRAKARLIIIASKKDRENPIIKQIASSLSGDTGSVISSIGEYVKLESYPGCLMGKTIYMPHISFAGKVTRIYGNKFTVRALNKQKAVEKTFDAGTIREKYMN